VIGQAAAPLPLPSCYTPPGEPATTIVRPDGRQPAELRLVRITAKYLPHAEGSALIELDNTTVLCALTVEMPAFLPGSGWLTVEYGMLPRST